MTPLPPWLAAVDQPILNASMAGVAGGRLAAAVTRGGGLGTIGFGTAVGAEAIARQFARAEGVPVGAGLVVWALRIDPRPLDAVLEHSPVMVSLSFGDPSGLVAVAHRQDVPVASQVGTPDEARTAIDAGVDVLIVRGGEGGGHGRAEVATLPLLQQILAMTDTPVIAAGGIADERGVAAVIGAGAVGAWVGTPFIPCDESDASDAVKRAVIAAGSTQTVYTRAFDVAQRIPWPHEYGGRALANDFTRQWSDDVHALEREVQRDDGVTDALLEARRTGDIATAPVYAGQSAGSVTRGRPAAEVVAGLGRFREVLEQSAQRFRKE